DLSAFNTQYGATENLVGIGIDDRLDEPASLRRLYGARNIRHGKLSDFDVTRLSARLGLGEADASELRVDKDSVWHEPAHDAAVTALEQVGLQDPIIVIRDM